MAPRKKKRKITIHSKETRILIGILLIASGTAVVLSETIEGTIPTLIFTYIGEGIVLFGFLLVLLGLRFIGFSHRTTDDNFLMGVLMLALWYIVTLAYFNYLFNTTFLPGILGETLHEFLWSFLGTILEGVTLAIVLLSSLTLIVGNDLLDLTAKGIQNLWVFLQTSTVMFVKGLIELTKKLATKITQRRKEEIVELDIEGVEEQPEIIKETKESIASQPLEEAAEVKAQPKEDQEEPNVQITFGKPLKDTEEEVKEMSEWLKRFYKLYKPRFQNWKLPPISEILLPPVKDSISAREIEETSRKIEEVLESFRIHAKVTKVFVGPSIIQYALNIASGTKVAKVRNLARDIALAIAAPSDSIRVDTIAGTTLVGVEVPRKKPRLVRAIEVIGSEEFKNSKFQLPLAIGKDIYGKPVILDLHDMPHLLIAGATGSGKSVTINVIVAGLLSRFSPDELKLIMVDPKMVEMEPYNNIPHLLAPVITDMNQTSYVLDWLLFEMQQRYQLFKETKSRSLKEYNEKADLKLPYIVLIIDEMADLILTKKSEVEPKVVRLAQLARATGIHLILATQRPSVNVITGLIKANIPARIALAVASNVDSRVIIDQIGAENLLGKGDMLIKTPDRTKPQRVQGAFISTQEVQKLTEYLRSQTKNLGLDQEELYFKEVLETLSGAPTSVGDRLFAPNADPLLRDAIELVVREQRVSASALQRYLKIGFNRAARLIDEMEKMGIVSPLIGNKRQVLVKDLSEIGL